MDTALTGALTLAGPEACLAHYRDWAASYDSGFAEEMQYLLPAHVAAAASLDPEHGHDRGLIALFRAA